MTDTQEFLVGISPISAEEFSLQHPLTPVTPIRAMRGPSKPIMTDAEFHVTWDDEFGPRCKCFGKDDMAAFRFAQALAIMGDCHDC